MIKKVDRIRRDFLWSGLDIDHPRCCLVGWKNLCRPHDQSGWSILDLASFNQSLLGKWWWKFIMDPSYCGAKVIQFNYGFSRASLWPNQSGRISFFWRGVLSCLPALRSCFSNEVITGKETFFWKDYWIIGIALMYLWPAEFRASSCPNGTIHELIHLLEEPSSPAM